MGSGRRIGHHGHFGHHGYGGRRAAVKIISTNESLEPQRAGCVTCVSYILLLVGIFMTFAGVPNLAIGYSTCGSSYYYSYDPCDFSGPRAAGVLLVAIGGTMVIIATLICCFVIRPTCCGFTMSPEMQRRYNEQNNIISPVLGQVTVVGGVGIVGGVGQTTAVGGVGQTGFLQPQMMSQQQQQQQGFAYSNYSGAAPGPPMYSPPETYGGPVGETLPTVPPPAYPY